jgi:hypothetical protein
MSIRFVPKADIPRCGKERRYSITLSARAMRVGGMVRMGSSREPTLRPPELATFLFASPAQNERDRHNGRSLQSLALTFGNNRWRRGFALAVVRSGLCGGRDAKESKRRCRQ